MLGKIHHPPQTAAHPGHHEALGTSLLHPPLRTLPGRRLRLAHHHPRLLRCHGVSSIGAGRPRTTMIPVTRTPRAFSLVELLVSIAVIALLIGVVLAALRPARDAAHAAACASNLRQIFIACSLHAAQNGGLGPAIGQPYAASPNWALVVQSSTGTVGSTPATLLNTRSLLVCPASPRADADMTRTYAMNAVGHNRAPWNADPDSYDDPWPPTAAAANAGALRPVGVRFDRVVHPARSALLVDSARVTQTPPLPPDRTASVIDFRPQAGHADRLARVHSGRFNAAMFDGSAAAADAPAQSWLDPLP